MVRDVPGKVVPFFPGKVTLQTDNGAEFSGTTRHLKGNHFHKAINSLGADHRYILPERCNANADVESIHATVEDEFFNLAWYPIELANQEQHRPHHVPYKEI